MSDLKENNTRKRYKQYKTIKDIPRTTLYRAELRKRTDVAQEIPSKCDHFSVCCYF